MSMETPLTCHCGHRVLHSDILQRGRFSRIMSPGFIYIKFRCSRCKRLGERFVPIPDWQASGGRCESPEVSPAERLRFVAMGGIGLDEVIDFHFELDSRSLTDLLPCPEA